MSNRIHFSHRHNAIKMAIKELAGEGDVVVLDGKGH